MSGLRNRRPEFGVSTCGSWALAKARELYALLERVVDYPEYGPRSRGATM
jgi:hypothetical protein